MTTKYLSQYSDTTGTSTGFKGTSNGQVATWSTAGGGEWFPGSSGGSGGGGAIFYLNSATAAASPTTNVPGGSGGATAYFAPAQTSKTFTATAQSRLSPPTGNLPNGSYAIVQGFLSDTALGLTSIPPGLWDFNIWAQASSGAGPTQTQFRVKVGVYDGTNAPTILASSDTVYIYDPTVAAQYPVSVVIPANTISATDRLYIEIDCQANTSGRNATFYFGGAQPSHVHTTIIVPIDLASADVTGTLGTTNGGTGIGGTTPYAIGDILYATGTSTLSKLPIGTAARVLTVNAGGTAPEWGIAAAAGVTSLQGTANQVLVANTSGSPQTGALTLTLPTTIFPVAAGTGSAFTLKGGDSTTVSTAGANLVLSGGAGTNGNANGGNVNLTGGAQAGSGVVGNVNVGTTATTVVVLGSSTIPTNLDGVLTLNSTTASYLKTSSNNIVPLAPASGTTVTLQALTQAAATGYALTITGGPTTQASGTGGALTLTGGVKGSGGTDGALSLGETNTASVTVGAAAIPTTIASATTRLTNVPSTAGTFTSFIGVESDGKLVKAGGPYDIRGTFFGTPSPSVILDYFIADRTFTIGTAVSGVGAHRFSCLAKSTGASVVLNIKKNGGVTPVFTATFASTDSLSNGLYVATISAVDVTQNVCAAGDVITVETSSGAVNANFSTPVWTIYATV